MGDPGQALEALEHGRRIQMAPEFFEELALAHLKMGDARAAAVSLWEGAAANPGNAVLTSRLAVLYRETVPQSCAVVEAGGVSSLNLGCPRVKEERCLAAANVVGLYRQTGREAGAEEARKGAIGMGCAVAP
jgi:hypothetical protein